MAGIIDTDFMSLPGGIDPDLLRAFLFIAEDGSFTRAAERVGRTQSAVSMQVQRLETLLGQKLFERSRGGAVELTPHGRLLLARAAEMVALNDSIWGAFRAPLLAGSVRLGTPDDYAWRYLPPVLARFADTHPAVQVEVICAPSEELAERLKAGELDLTLISEGVEPKGWSAVPLWRGPLLWLTSERHAVHRRDPLPLAVAASGCSWAEAAVRALDQAKRRYRIAYMSGSQAGTLAPVLAGLAVTVSIPSWLPEGIVALKPGEVLPVLPDFAILMLKGRKHAGPAVEALATHMTETFRLEAAKAAQSPPFFASAA
ncbi:MAG TPA: LysR substrate-binding domain-containing protein [Acetobacteraceae bacterium]|nr:LysR substrate-binding domain-containing protein [Acetobacteraceae bacterium]